MYVLSMRGSKPTYYTQDQANEAREKYNYMRRYFCGVSLQRISYNRFLKDCIVTGRTA